eukprot:TRINITY_DN2685_c0_g1_i1.p1 TRINITY_DN2685_c0_g1~~TRINITY_DN2685_c0_g1_i1.p1  ORF type:complete len:472 (+),score=85.91 TRINITY_DN2685_c0_g1_i1:628-2043(+)
MDIGRIIENKTYPEFRILAMECLDISNHTLVYGTPDATKTIKFAENDNEVRNIVESLSEELKLEPHPVKEISTDKIVKMHVAADVEFHRINDKVYVLDTGRIIPPNSKNMPLLYIYRNEYLQKFLDCKLSPDVFVGFGRIDRDKYNGVAMEQLKQFENFVVSEDTCIYMIKNITALNHVKDTFHRRGINLRYMGQVFTKMMEMASSDNTEDPFLVVVNNVTLRCIFIEMILRTLKTLYQNICRNDPLATHDFRIYLKPELYPQSTFWCKDKEGSLSNLFGLLSLKYKFDKTKLENLLFNSNILNETLNIWELLKVTNIRSLVEEYLYIILNISCTNIDVHKPRIKWPKNIERIFISHQIKLSIYSSEVSGLEEFISTIPPSSLLPNLADIFEEVAFEDHFDILNVVLQHFIWEYQSKENKTFLAENLLALFDRFETLNIQGKQFLLTHIDLICADDQECLVRLMDSIKNFN